jgi:hypothetical protein
MRDEAAHEWGTHFRARFEIAKSCQCRFLKTQVVMQR